MRFEYDDYILLKFETDLKKIGIGRYLIEIEILDYKKTKIKYIKLSNHN